MKNKRVGTVKNQTLKKLNQKKTQKQTQNRLRNRRKRKKTKRRKKKKRRKKRSLKLSRLKDKEQLCIIFKLMSDFLIVL